MMLLVDPKETCSFTQNFPDCQRQTFSEFVHTFIYVMLNLSEYNTNMQANSGTRSTNLSKTISKFQENFDKQMYRQSVEHQ